MLLAANLSSYPQKENFDNRRIKMPRCVIELVILSCSVNYSVIDVHIKMMEADNN